MSVLAIETTPKLKCSRCKNERVLSELGLCLSCTIDYEKAIKKHPKGLSVERFIGLFPYRYRPCVKDKKEREREEEKFCIRCPEVGKLDEYGLCLDHCHISFRRRSEEYKKKHGREISFTEYLGLYPYRSKTRNDKRSGFKSKDEGRDGLVAQISKEQVASLVQGAKSCHSIFGEKKCKSPYCLNGCTFKRALVAQKVGLSLYGLTPTLK
jgi:hypothetical protein